MESVDQTAGTDKAQVTAAMPDGEGSLGGSASFSVYMESDIYPLVIPIEALREDNIGSTVWRQSLRRQSWAKN